MIPLGVLASSHVVAISYVSSAAASAATVNVSSVGVGDLIVVLAGRYANATIPTLPAGWTSLATISNTFGVRVGYKLATAAGSQSVGTWTGADQVAVGVWRGAGAPSKGDIKVADGTPALSGLAAGAWISAFISVIGGPGPAVAGLTQRLANSVYDSAGPMSSRAAISDAGIMVGALVEIPPRT